jgi:iduronate 2-sulfatase
MVVHETVGQRWLFISGTLMKPTPTPHPRGLILSALLLVTSVALCGQTTRPNILLLAYDDLKPALGAYGYPLVKSPNIDALAARGAVFINAACQYPVCGPSRASLLTGQRPETTGVLDLSTKMRDVQPNVVTLPQFFKNRGYATAGIGKIFDPRCVDSRAQGDAISWTVPYNEQPSYGTAPLPIVGNPAFASFANQPDTAYPDGCIARKAIEQLNTFAAGSAPFFLAVGFKKPHLPFIAPARHWNKYTNADIELASYQQATQGNSGYGLSDSGEMRSFDGMPASGPFPAATQKNLIHGYLACVSWVDELTGRLINELEVLGLKENTIIVLWGDHGFHLGDHGIWGKHTAYEEAVRSPLIIVDPRKGNVTRRVASPVDFIDIYPTLVELAGATPIAQLQGVSLAQNLTDAGYKARTHSTALFKSRGAYGYSIRTPRYRYIEWISPTTHQLVGRDLYDFIDDPDDALEPEPLGRINRANDPAYAGAANYLAGLLHANTVGMPVLQRYLDGR